MIFLTLLLQLSLCVSILHRELVVRESRNLASSAFFTVYCIVYVLQPLLLHAAFGGATTIVSGSSAKLDDPLVYLLQEAYGLLLLTTWLLFGQTRDEEIAAQKYEPADVTSSVRFGYLTAILVFGTVAFVRSSGMSVADLLVASRFSWVEAPGFSSLLLNVSGYCIGVAAVWAFWARVKPRPTMLVALGFLALLAHGILTKDRKWILYLISGALAASYERNGRRIRIPLPQAVGLVAVFVFLVISQFVRDVVFRIAIGEQLSLGEEFGRWLGFLLEKGDISYFYRASLETLHQNIHHGVLVPFGVVRRVLFFFLPSAWSGGLKVEDLSAIFSDVVHGEDSVRRGSMPPGFFGLFVLSFGWLPSVFLIPLVSIGLRRLDRWFRSGVGIIRSVSLAMFGFIVVMAFRGDESSAWYFPVGALLFVGLGALVAPLRENSDSLRQREGALAAASGDPGISR